MYICVFCSSEFQHYSKIECRRSIGPISSASFGPIEMRLAASYETAADLSDEVLEKYIRSSFPGIKTMSSNNGIASKVELYGLDEEDALAFLNMIADISGTCDRLTRYPEKSGLTSGNDYEEEDEELFTRAGNLKFSDWGIRPGEELVFRYDPTIKVRVKNDKQVSYKGKPYFLTHLADLLCGKTTKNGARCFTYKGIILSNLEKKSYDGGEN